LTRPEINVKSKNYNKKRYFWYSNLKKYPGIIFV
jgi:hypothetical protein